MSMRAEILSPVEEDGLVTPEVNEYAKSKYSLLYDYATIFSTSMKEKWKNRVYIDLFSGAGKSRLKRAGSVLLSSPLLALSVPDPFTRYVFCESDPERLSALRGRVSEMAGEADCRYVEGDVNDSIDQLLASIPSYSRGSGVLSFCFVDPYRMADLRFETIAALSRIWVDFLILLPTHMEFSRWCGQHFKSDSSVVADFIGVPDWRSRWSHAEASGVRPAAFLLNLYCEKMKDLGYEFCGRDDVFGVTEPTRNRRLYLLAFFSRHKLGSELFRKARRHSARQRDLFR